MKPRIKTALGIDLGGRRISAALVEKTERGARVLASATGDLSAAQDTPAPGKVLAQVLRTLGMRGRMRRARVAVAVPMGSAMMRLLEVPKPMPTNLGDFVGNELKQYVALSGRTVTSDFCGIGVAGGTRRRLLAVAADAEEVQEALKACGAAGIPVDCVEPAALAHLRAFLTGGTGLGYNHQALVAMLSRTQLVVCVVRKGVLDFVRLREMPIGMDSPDSLGAWLTEELNAVVRYCRPAAPLRVGADASGEGPEWQAGLMIHDAAYSKDEIVSRLALEPEVKSVAALDGSGPAEIAGGPVEGAWTSASVVAVGAALRLLDLEGDELRIDVTPREMVQARASSRQALILANAAAALMIGIFLTAQVLAKTNDARYRRIEQTRIADEIPTMSALVQEDWYLDQEIAQMQQQVRSLETTRVEREVDWPAVLRTIWQARPAGTSVAHVACENGRTLVVKGTAPSPTHTKTFVQNLGSRAPLESVWLAHVQRRQEEGDAVAFEINCAVRAMK